MPQAAAAACASLAGFALLARFGSGVPRSRLDASAAAFLAAAALSAVFSIDRALSLSGAYPDPVFSLAGFCLCAAALALGGGFRAEGLAPVLRRAFVWASIPVSVYALLQRAGMEPWMPLAGLPHGGRPISTLGSPLFLGAYLAMVLPLALETAREGGRRRLAAGIALFALLAALAATLARSAWLGATAGAVLWRLTRGPLPTRRTFLTAACAASLLLILLGGYAALRRANLAANDAARVEGWRIAARAFARRPLAGVGPDAFIVPYRAGKSERSARTLSGVGAQTQAHNDLLQVLATLGLLGLLPYLWLHLRMGERLSRCVGDGEAAAAGAAAVAVWTAAKFTAVSLSTVWPAALFAGVCAGAPGQERAAVRRLRAALSAAALAFGSAAVVRSAAADREARRGLLARRGGDPRAAAAFFERAIALRPEATGYRYDLVNLLRDVAEGLPVPARTALTQRGREVAEEGLRFRPLDADAHRLLGKVELAAAVSGEAGRLASARSALERSRGLDPTYAVTARDLSAVCRMMGDRKGEQEALEVYMRTRAQ